VVNDKSPGSAAVVGNSAITSLLFIAKFGSENFKLGEWLSKLQTKRFIRLCAFFALHLQCSASRKKERPDS